MTGNRPFNPQRRRRHRPKRSHAGNTSLYENCRIDPALNTSFRKIGKPAAKGFKPDLFQLEALEKLKQGDVLVSAPTGSGKTWIAIQAIRRNLTENLRAWYASPLKALSNSLYEEFKVEFGPELCGILTGERKENTDAPLIVGTTEILRNQLYDNMHEGTNLSSDLVILDEAHYLSDPDRGVVWEEVLIYLPPRVRLLLLSATVSNAGEVCGWLMKNRKTKAHVVKAVKRPVPLETLFLFPDGLMAPLSGKKGLSPKIKKFIFSNSSRGQFRGRVRPGYDSIINCLRKQNLLPAIFFLKSRMDCDDALSMCRHISADSKQRAKLKKEAGLFLKEYPHLENHRHLKLMTQTLIASHHAGHLPYWKVLIERMMNRGYLDAIFSTSTVAAGVNFPARCVVLVQSDKFNGHAFNDLTATELHQMTGRAGRRGMDNIGFVVLIPGVHQNVQLIHELINSEPEPLVSQIQINFSMVLNLLLSHTPDDVKTLLELSFARYQDRNKGTWIRAYLDDILNTLSSLLPGSRCDSRDPFEVTELISEREGLKRQEKRRAGKDYINGSHEHGYKRETLLCKGCRSLSSCNIKTNKPLRKALANFKSSSFMLSRMGETQWINFKRHLRFLKDTGFADEAGRLTQDGEWASKLRIDQPLLIGEAIRQGGVNGASPAVMAGLTALFVWDREQEVETRLGSIDRLDIMIDAYDTLISSMEQIIQYMDRRGFSYPQIMFWPGAALFLWAEGTPWEILLKNIPISEGDMASLIVRTADHLRQMLNLEETHPILAATARNAMGLILREPVFLD
ncbi:MAG: DEAD/DEAH box helicase [Deltaproteobacteria bacterium]|nr:DEAD/DEAH box helicase [Deltaproteobacteria bacterium]